MARKNGTSFKVYVNGEPIAQSTSGTLNVNLAEIDITSKDSNGYKEILPGLRDWSLDAEYLEDTGAASAVEFSDLYALWTGRTEVEVRLSEETSSNSYYIGRAYISSLSLDTPMEDKITSSVSFMGTGLLNQVALT